MLDIEKGGPYGANTKLIRTGQNMICNLNGPSQFSIVHKDLSNQEQLIMSVHTHASSAAHTLRPTRAPTSNTPTATQTITSTPVLRLRATAPTEQTRRPRIQWAEDVVDNEGLGRKRSKGKLTPPYIFESKASTRLKDP